MKVVKVALCVLCGVPMLALADQPATQPVDRPDAPMVNPNWPGGPPGPRMGMLHQHRVGDAFRAQPSPEQWSQMLTFMDENSPHRAEALRDLNLPAGSPVRAKIFSKYRAYILLKDSAPQMAEDHLKRLRLEDDVFGLVMDLRKNPADRDQLKNQIHDKAGELVRLGIEEHKHRIVALQGFLESEKAIVDRDSGKIDQLTDEQTDRILQRADKPMSPEAPKN